MTTLKEIWAPHLGRTVKMGRKRPAYAPHFYLKDYLLTGGLPIPPTTCDYSVKAASLSQMFLNDQLGDCVIAAGYHLVGTETGNAGEGFVASSTQITTDYSNACGYVPGNESTDNGCDEQTTFQYWQKNGFADGTKLLGWLAVNPSNVSEIQTAIYLFEDVFFGLELPDAWITPFPSANGFVWDVAGAPDPNNGHAVDGMGYNGTGVTICTWGLLGTMTYAAIAEYCASSNNGELYVLITPDEIVKGLTTAPNGLNWSQLITDFNSMGGNVPVPSPPTPPAPPTPQPKAKTLLTIDKPPTFTATGGATPPTGSVTCFLEYAGDSTHLAAATSVAIPLPK